MDPRRARPGDGVVPASALPAIEVPDMDATPRRSPAFLRSQALDAHDAHPAQAAAPARVDAGLGRFLYYVRPAVGGWELQFGFDGTRFTYASEHEALEAAREAARLHWETTHAPSGVYLVSPTQGRRLLDIFGMRG
jgi:hypothetical protein